jgi:excisionase family DNA binding protein
MDKGKDDVRPPYRIPEASRRLGISDQCTRLLIIRGELDGFKLGRTWLIRPESVDRLLRGEVA